MKGAFLALVAVLVVAAVALTVLAPRASTVPGINTGRNAAGEIADGWADITFDVGMWSCNSGGETPQDSFCPQIRKVAVAETLGIPSGEATLPAYSAPAGADCHAQVRLDASGPHLDSVSSTTPDLVFLAGQDLKFAWGHLYLYAGSTYTLRFTVEAWNCFNYFEPTVVMSFSEILLFDGHSEEFFQGGP